jgi:hypothetical protein
MPIGLNTGLYGKLSGSLSLGVEPDWVHAMAVMFIGELVVCWMLTVTTPLRFMK